MNPGGYQKGSGARYWIGSFDGKTFVADDPNAVMYVDHGSDFYALTTFFNVWNDPRSRTGIAWMSNWDYASKLPTDPWRGQMSFPRDFTLQTY